MSDWGEESEGLFRAARRELSPPSGERERVRARIAAGLGAGAIATGVAVKTQAAVSGGAAVAGTAAKGASLSLAAKIIVPTLVVGAGALGTAWLVGVPSNVDQRAPQVVSTGTATVTAPSGVVVQAPLSTAAPAPPAPPEDVALPASITTAAPSAANVRGLQARHVRGTPRAGGTAVVSDEEARLVSEIDAALRGGNTARASQLADEHQRRFPSGLLVEEREGSRVLVRCAASPDAKAAATFLRAHPRSPMRARILTACGELPPER